MPNCEMVRHCFSTPELAFSGGLDYFNENEETIYVCEVKYPSGVEYHLKKKILNGVDCLHTFQLKESHKFREFSSAMKAIAYFKNLGIRLCVKKKYKIENGYKFIKYYYLCSM